MASNVAVPEVNNEQNVIEPSTSEEKDADVEGEAEVECYEEIIDLPAEKKVDAKSSTVDGIAIISETSGIAEIANEPLGEIDAELMNAILMDTFAAEVATVENVDRQLEIGDIVTMVVNMDPAEFNADDIDSDENDEIDDGTVTGNNGNINPLNTEASSSSIPCRG